MPREVPQVPPSVSGTLERGLLEVARDVVGADTLLRGVERAPPVERAAVEGALPGVWVPIVSVERTFASIAEAAGRELPGLHLELARISVERALKTFWRMLLRLTSDEALISRTPVIFGKSYNRGRLVPSIVSPGRGGGAALGLARGTRMATARYTGWRRNRAPRRRTEGRARRRTAHPDRRALRRDVAVSQLATRAG